MHAIDLTNIIMDRPVTTQHEVVGNLELWGSHYGVEFWATDGMRDWTRAISDWRGPYDFSKASNL